MEVLRIITAIQKCIKYLGDKGNESGKLEGEFEGGLRWLAAELDMIKFGIEEYEELPMQELVYEIHDFISALHIHTKYAALLLSVLGRDPRPRDISRISHFKASIKSIEKRKPVRSGPSQSGCTSSDGSPPPSYAQEEDLVGFPKAKDKLLELLWEPADDSQLRVISIVGSSGVGKTALARAVYESTAVVPLPPQPATEIYEANAAPAIPIAVVHCKSWVVASKCNSAEDLVKQVLKELDPTAEGYTIQDLHNFLKDKRYLVFIDDMQPKGVLWQKIAHAFPQNYRGSRIVVTTSVHSIARFCSRPGGYYVYQMQCLNEADSKELFRKVYCRFGGVITLADEIHLGSIFGKCGGLPLALTNAAEYIRGTGLDLSYEHCKGFCVELDNYLECNESAFDELKRALVKCYDDLPHRDHRNCLLYVSIFPRGYQINSKSMARRLVAEGLVGRGDASKKLVGVCGCLEELIDKSMIEPVPFHNNSRVAKGCKVHGAMLEFTIQKSLSRNFVSLIDEDNSYRCNGRQSVRRLTIQYSGIEAGSSVLPDNIELSTVRSLTIFKGNLLLKDFKRCKVLRVLDLEGCKGLYDMRVVEAICELLFLNYLSLRKTDVYELPTRIEVLVHLATLDIRETQVEILPVKVIMLQELACLFGKFELQKLTDRERSVLTEFLKNKSKLHTVAGVLLDKSEGFQVIIVHARNLKNIKIGSKDTAPASALAAPRGKLSVANLKLSVANLFCFSGNPAQEDRDRSNLVKARRLVCTLVSSLEKRFTDLDSISIDSSDCSKAFLASLNGPCRITCIKLRGILANLHTLTKVSKLNKLHLFSPRLKSKDLWVTLQSIKLLQYLKLTEEDNGFWDDSFDVPAGEDVFPCLKELCFESTKIEHPLLRIAERALCPLTSLQLFCPDSSDAPRIEGISHLANLKEVILHHSAHNNKIKAWEKVANENSNKPSVKKQPISTTA